LVSPRKIPMTVERIIEYSDDLWTIIFKTDKRIPRFKPGQFLHLTIDPYNPSIHWPESRVFSIVTSPLDTNSISITIAKKGAYTTRIFTELKEGNTIWIKMPYGNFTIKSNGNSEVVLIAGGTGITPFMSFINTTVREEKHFLSPIKLFYGVRNPESLIFQNEVEACKQKMKNFAYSYSIQNPRGNETFDYHPGILSIDKIWGVLEYPYDAVYYLSGPPEMIQSFKKLLLSKEISPDQIQFDAWE
jgi:ferredoxin-NADP reductase